MFIHCWGTRGYPPWIGNLQTSISIFEVFTAAVSATKKKDLVSCPSLWPWLLKRANRRRQWGPNDQPVGPEVWNAWPVSSLGSKHGLLQSYFKLIQRGLHMLTLPMARPMMRRGWGPQRQFYLCTCLQTENRQILAELTLWYYDILCSFHLLWSWYCWCFLVRCICSCFTVRSLKWQVCV